MESIIETNIQLNILKRPRRNRQSPVLRQMIAETQLHVNDLATALFLVEGKGIKQEIPSLPEVFRMSLDVLLLEVQTLHSMGIKAIDLFPVIPKSYKDSAGSYAYSQNNILWEAIKTIKDRFPDICLMVDVALDPYTDHGHDGVMNEKGKIANDPTVEALGRLSLLAAEAGVDLVAPSDMMDGRVKYIRQILDGEGYEDVGIMSYAAKYASALYGPFRDALGACPIGDKKTYQMDPANCREALLECALDEEEGADILMVKPASLYLDVIAKLRQQTNLPIAAYHVSGEYSMVKAAAKNGWINGPKVMYETLLSIKRAGADIIFTYAAKDMVQFF